MLLNTDDNVTLLPATIDLAGAEALLLMRRDVSMRSSGRLPRLPRILMSSWSIVRRRWASSP